MYYRSVVQRILKLKNCERVRRAADNWQKMWKAKKKVAPVYSFEYWGERTYQINDSFSWACLVFKSFTRIQANG